MKITTKLASNGNVTFVTHKHFAILFFLLSCCVNSLLSHSGLQGTGYHATETKRRAWNVNVTLFYTHHFLIVYFYLQINFSKTILSEAVNTTNECQPQECQQDTNARKKERKKEKKKIMYLKLVCFVCLDLYSWLTEHTFNSKDLTESVQMQILTISQNAKCLVIEVVSILQFISLSHYLHEMIQWAIYSLIVKQVFPFQFWHALLVLCTPLSSAQWSYAEIRQKKQW